MPAPLLYIFFLLYCFPKRDRVQTSFYYLQFAPQKIEADKRKWNGRTRFWSYFFEQSTWYIYLSKIHPITYIQWSFFGNRVCMIFLDLTLQNPPHYQGCIFRLTCFNSELTKDHVLTSAYVKFFWTVTRNVVNKSVWRKKDCSWLPLNKHAMNIFI